MTDSVQSAAAGPGDPKALLSSNLVPGQPVVPLESGDPRRGEGPVPAGRVYVARPPGGWELSRRGLPGRARPSGGPVRLLPRAAS